MFKPGTFLKSLSKYKTKCDSILESHFTKSFILTEYQKILVIELYGSAIVIDRYMKLLLNGKDPESVNLSKVSIPKSDFIKLSEMVKIIKEVILEIEDTGISLQEI